MAALNAPRIFIFDANNVLQDVPGDVLSVSFETVMNGGSGQGQVVFPRKFAQYGLIGPDYRFQVWLPDDVSGDPWYDGRVTEIDTSTAVTSGRATAYLEGYATALDDAICTFSVNPGVQPDGVDNGQMDFGALVTWVLTTYLPVGFTFNAPPSAGLNVDGIQVDHEGLGSTINDIVKIVLDGNGSNWEWYCDGTADLQRVVTVQPVSTFEVAPISLDWASDMAENTLRENFRDIKNMVVVYGGLDPITGEQQWGPFQDSVSISAFGVRQTSQNQSTLVTFDQIAVWATSYLAQTAYPSFTGTVRLRQFDSNIRAGKWVQVFTQYGTEQYFGGTTSGYTPAPPDIEYTLLTMRLSKVTVTWSKSTRIDQTFEPTSPIPFIDRAVFDSANGVATLLGGLNSRPFKSGLDQIACVIAGGGLSTS